MRTTTEFTSESSIWFEKLPPNASWTNLWSDYIICGCTAIRKIDEHCPVCNSPSPSLEPEKIILRNGEEITIPLGFPGAEERYEDYLLLQMMQREWNRSDSMDENAAFTILSQTSVKALLVLIFWTYFETKIERLLRMGLKDVPRGLIENTLNRYSSIGSRLDTLYQVVFNSKYYDDLAYVGYPSLVPHIKYVQRMRNEFIHGNPCAIDDRLVRQVVEYLKDDHEAWIKIYNKNLASKLQDSNS